MTADALLCARAKPLRLVIFDCDGVLIDSEAVTNRIIAEYLTKLGWPMDTATAQRTFLGMSLPDMEPVIAARIGRPTPPAWRAALTGTIIAAMQTEAVLVDGALAALDATDALGLPWRVASNSSHRELAAKFARTGLSTRTAGRVHSHTDVARGKPAPDLFLAAAAAQRVPPAHCLVIEDSAIGAAAARSAGMDCLGYAPHGNIAALVAHGAAPFRSMHEIGRLLTLATQVPA